MENNQIIKSHEQPKNLKQLLTKANSEEQEQNNEPTVSKCGRLNCVICEIIITGKSFKFKNGRLKFGSVKPAVDSDSYWGNAMIGMYRGKRKVVLLYS